MVRPPDNPYISVGKIRDTSPNSQDHGPSLEAVELEFALGAQSVLNDGFETALAKAAAMAGGRMIFNLPAIDTADAQRIGAVLITGETGDQVIFVTLHNDGTTMSLRPLTGSDKVLESLGRNYVAVMKSLAPEITPND